MSFDASLFSKQAQLSDRVSCASMYVVDRLDAFANDQRLSFALKAPTPRLVNCLPDVDDRNALVAGNSRNTRALGNDSQSCDLLLSRGGNNVPGRASICVGDECPAIPTTLVWPVCPINTYKNDQVCDGVKCCSRSHQLFENVTRRRHATAARTTGSRASETSGC
jgi:hypothetical protein